MSISEMIYYKGERNSMERVGVTFTHGDYIDDCVVVKIDLLCDMREQYFVDGKSMRYRLTVDNILEILRFAQAEREKILAAYPIKTYEGWSESGVGNFGEYCKPGEQVDDALVDYFLNVVPPATFRSNLIQAGEPYSNEFDSETGKYRSTFMTFAVIDGVWRYCGVCFAGQTQNRETCQSRLDRAIKALEKAAG